MHRMRQTKLGGFIALGLALGLGTASAQDKTFELKLSHWVPPSHPLQKSIRRSSSARRSTITTWRATASPMSPM